MRVRSVDATFLPCYSKRNRFAHPEVHYQSSKRPETRDTVTLQHIQTSCELANYVICYLAMYARFFQDEVKSTRQAIQTGNLMNAEPATLTPPGSAEKQTLT